MEKYTFVHEVANQLACDERRAEDVTFAVFRELRNRLTPKEAGDVAAQLPAALKCVWREGDVPGRRVARTHRAEFFADVRSRAGLADDAEAERAVRVVFATLQTVLGRADTFAGEAWDVFSQLPKDLKQVWLTSRAPRPTAAHR
jgi:uncharacterized protein (DUF2267 family)